MRLIVRANTIRDRLLADKEPDLRRYCCPNPRASSRPMRRGFSASPYWRRISSARSSPGKQPPELTGRRLMDDTRLPARLERAAATSRVGISRLTALHISYPATLRTRTRLRCAFHFMRPSAVFGRRSRRRRASALLMSDITSPTPRPPAGDYSADSAASAIMAQRRHGRPGRVSELPQRHGRVEYSRREFAERRSRAAAAMPIALEMSGSASSGKPPAARTCAVQQ